MALCFLKAAGTVVALFALRAALAQYSVRHSLEFTVVGRQTANEVTYVRLRLV